MSQGARPARKRMTAAVGALVVVMAAMLVMRPEPAYAACHIAGFVQESVDAAEEQGTVTLTIELQGGRPSCEGEVTWATEDGTAVAGEDYEAADGTVSFVAGDDRMADIQITLLDDAESEEPEQFSVLLTGTSGSITGTAAGATVTISDDDPVGEGEPTETTEPTETQDEERPEPTQAAEDSNATTILVVIVVLAAAVVAGGVLWRRRS